MNQNFKGLIDEKVSAVLDVFLKNPDELYHINMVSELSRVPISTAFRIIKNLVELKILDKKTIGKFGIYKLASGEKTKYLKKALK